MKSTFGCVQIRARTGFTKTFIVLETFDITLAFKFRYFKVVYLICYSVQLKFDANHFATSKMSDFSAKLHKKVRKILIVKCKVSFI